jgi:hypothetical protein
MQAVCPKDPTHKQFITVAHVSQDWLVDSNGAYLAFMGEGENIAEPNAGNTWKCLVCETEAQVFENHDTSPIGRCPNCQEYGIVGEPCRDHLSNKAICKNFHYQELMVVEVAEEADPVEFGDLMDSIREAMAEMPGDEVARVHNSICSNPVKYVEDSEWRREV